MELRKYINIVEGVKRRASEQEFIQKAREMFGAKAAKLSISDLAEISDKYAIQVPTALKFNRELKVDAHHWNLSGSDDEAVDRDVERQTGERVEKPDDSDPAFQNIQQLAKAKEVANLAASGKIYLFGRKPKGAFFKIPGVDQLTAQLARMLDRQLADSAQETMEEQYEELLSKVELIASGKSNFIKSLLICGSPSSGKSFSVMQAIKNLGLEEGKDYTITTGNVSAASVYRKFIENLNKLTIFDDCDSVLESDPNILKAALGSDKIREISKERDRGMLNVSSLSFDEREVYVQAVSNILNHVQTSEDIAVIEDIYDKMHIKNKILAKWLKQKEKNSKNEDDDADNDNFGDISEGDSEKDDILMDFAKNNLPSKFNFKGRVIFISNMSEEELAEIGNGAILSRSFYQNVTFPSDQMLDFIEKLAPKMETPGLSIEEKMEVIQYIRELYQTGKFKRDINFRVVQQCWDIRFIDSAWKKMIAKY